MSESFRPPSQTPWKHPAGVTGIIWIALLALFVAHGAIAGDLTLGDALQQALAFWGVWIVAGPLVAWMATRFPIEQGKRLPHLGIHIVMCATILTANLWLVRGRGAGRGGLPLPRNPPGAEFAGPGRDRPTGWLEGRPGFSFGRRSRSGPPFGRALIDVLIYGFTATATQGVLWARRARQRELRAVSAESQLVRARLSALQMQLNPHFLFNALNGISTLIHTNPAAADSMLGDLSDLLRCVLESADTPTVELRRELDFLEKYLAIEKTRFENRLRLTTELDPATLSATIPTLLLQPLVENAVKHGIEPQRAPGEIIIRTRRQGDRLHVVIHNSTPNTSAEAVPGRKAGRTIGLANTRGRLEQMFPGSHQFSAEKTGPDGFTVSIAIPFTPAPTPTGSTP